MTGPQWESEVAKALVGSDWAAAYANVTQDMNDCLLEARHRRSGECRHVAVNAGRFLTPEARQAEVRRQLSK